jgi:hypothetical protein
VAVVPILLASDQMPIDPVLSPLAGLAGSAVLWILVVRQIRLAGPIQVGWRPGEGRWRVTRQARRAVFVLAALVLLACTLAVALPQLERPIADHFHEGELLGALPLVERGTDVPILIHGPGRNLLPAQLAQAIAPSGQFVATVRTFDRLQGAVAFVLALAAAWIVVRASFAAAGREVGGVPPALSLLAVAALLGCQGGNSRPALFLAGVMLGTAVVSALVQERRPRLLLTLPLGAVFALAPIYVYGASVQLALFGLVFALCAAVIGGRYGFAAVGHVGIGAAVAAACALIAGAWPLYAHAFRDILWWGMEARGMWALPIDSGTTTNYFVLVSLVVAIGLACAWKSARERRYFVLLLTATLVIATQDVWERADADHVQFALYATGPVAAAIVAPYAAALLRDVRVLAGLVALFAVPALLSAAEELPEASWRLSERTADAAVVGAELNVFREAVRARGDRSCLLSLTNEGTLYFAAGLPPCGPFFYPVYGSTARGDAMLSEWLAEHRPGLVVTDSAFWSVDIDQKPMSERLPRTWMAIDTALPYEQQVGSRTIRTRDGAGR